MATTFDLLNHVLIGLRKTKLDVGTTVIADPYHLLLLEYINIAKNEVEGAWDWQGLRDVAVITTTPGVQGYSMSIAGGASNTDVPHNARLMYERVDVEGHPESTTKYAASLPHVYDVTDSAEFRLHEQHFESMARLINTDDDERGKSVYFAIHTDDPANGRFKRVTFFPVPEEERTIRFRFFVPQADLTADDLTTELRVSDRPVWLKALFYANQERGEELGRPGSTLDKQADEALALAIAPERTDVDNTSYPQ